MDLTYQNASLLRFRRARGTDIFEKARIMEVARQSAREAGAYAYRTVCSERRTGEVWATPEGGTGRWVIDGASNDYLGLSDHPEILAAIEEATRRYGVSANGAAMLAGNTPVHIELEQALARFLGKEDVLLAPSGFAVMQGVTQGMLSPTDVVFSDRYNHASLDSGIRLSGARAYRYPHRDMGALRKLLGDHRGEYHGAMIVSDGVFSVHGTVAPVAELEALAREFDCRLLIDDAHGIGVLGGGRGCGASDGVDLLAGTLSKALVGSGGFVAGPAEVMDYLRTFGSAACVTSNLSVATAAAALAALRLVERFEGRGQALVEASGAMKRALRDRGVEIGVEETPILHLCCKTDVVTYHAWRDLLADGLLCHALPFPIVPIGHSGIRVRLTTRHTPEQLDRITDILAAHFGRTEAAVATSVAPERGQASSGWQRVYPRSAPVFLPGFESHPVSTTRGPLVVHRRLGRSRTTLVLLHPLLFGSTLYRDVLLKVPTDLSCLAVDFFGHGESAPIAENLSIEELADALDEVLAGLGMLGPVALVGTSMGGMVAQRFALAHPERVSHLLLVGTSADREEGPSRTFYESLFDTAQSIGAEALGEDLVGAMFSARFVERTAPDRPTDLVAELSDRPVASVHSCVHAVLRRRGWAKELPAIQASTVVLVGDEDMAEPLPHSERLAARIPDAELRVVQGSGHLVPVERPETLSKVIEEWRLP